VFPPRRPPDRGLEHTLDLRLPRIREWMGEPQGAMYTSMIELHRGCQRMRIKEPDTHRSVPRYHQEILVVPLGLTDTLVTLQSCRQLSRQILWCFDALSEIWEDHLNQLSQTDSPIAAIETIHWDLVIRVCGAQWESQILLGSAKSF
jgi:hypothetical protein